MSNTVVVPARDYVVPVEKPRDYTSVTMADGFLKIRSVDYQSVVLATEPASLITYWPLDDTSGTTIVDQSGNGRNGAYSNVSLLQDGIGDDGTSAYFNGTTSYGNIYSAALAAAFNGAEGTLLIWAKVANAGVWTDATTRRLFRIGIDANNYIIIARSTTNNAIQANYGAGGTDRARAVTVGPNLNFFCNCLTWSKSQDKVIFYINGVQQGATLTGLGTWAGVPIAANTVIGATSTAPANVFSGWLAHCALWSKALTPAQIATVSALPEATTPYLLINATDKLIIRGGSAVQAPFVSVPYRDYAIPVPKRVTNG